MTRRGSKTAAVALVLLAASCTNGGDDVTDSTAVPTQSVALAEARAAVDAVARLFDTTATEEFAGISDCRDDPLIYVEVSSIVELVRSAREADLDTIDEALVEQGFEEVERREFDGGWSGNWVRRSTDEAFDAFVTRDGELEITGISRCARPDADAS